MNATETLSKRAQALIDVGRPGDAVPLLHQALGLDSKDHRALCLLSLAHYHLSKHKEALKHADQAISAAPDREWGHRLRALSLMRLQKYREALKAAQESARCDPRSTHALHTLTQALLRASRPKEARATAERLRALAPESPIAHEALTLVALNQGRWKEAERHARRALSLRPESYYYHHQLAMALQRQGRIIEAAEAYYQALQTDPSQKAARSELRSALLFLIHPWLLYLALVIGVVGRAQMDTGPGHTDVLAYGLAHPGWIALLIGIGAALAVYGQFQYRRLPPHLRNWWKRK